MKYYSHYIWESGSEEKENAVSIVLQQVKLRKCRCLLACVCEGKGEDGNACLTSGYFTERLVEWFHQKCIPVLQKKQSEKNILQILKDELKHIEQELQEYGQQKGMAADYDTMGMVVCDSMFYCFLKGNCQGYFFNRRFNKKQKRNLKELLFPGEKSSGFKLTEGSLQKGVGILLSSRRFDTNISEEEMLEVLSEEHLEDRDIQKRLRELWQENMMRGELGSVGAVFFRPE